MKKKSIRAQMILICIGNMLVLQMILLVNYSQSKAMLMENNQEHYEEIITQIEGAVDESCQYLNDMLMEIAYSKNVQEYLESEDVSYRQEKITEIRNYFEAFANLKYGIKDIALFAKNGDVVNFQGSPLQLETMKDEISEEKSYYYTGIHSFHFPGSTGKTNCFCVGMNIYSTSDYINKEATGTILLTFNPQSILRFMRYKEKKSVENIIVYDREKKIVYSSVPEELLKEYEKKRTEKNKNTISLEGSMYQIQRGDLDMLHGEIVFLISEKELLEGIDILQRKLVLLSILGWLVMLVISLVVMRNIIRPMNQLMHYMQEMEEGNLKLLKQPISLSGTAEIEILSDRFNHMMGEINNLTHRLVATTSRLYESKIEKQQAELEYMRSQINPHFLFNTLESIKGCAVDENAGKTFRMLNSLGKLFRYCVRGNGIVTLREELSVIESYMSLQKIRFEDRLVFWQQISEALEEYCVPKMILQPLLENAVVHGMEENGAVQVQLEGKVEENNLILIITDDGKKISKEKREEIRKNMYDHVQTAHVGLGNVHYRLKYMYGEAYGLTLGEVEQGFQVIVKLPCRKGELYDV